MSLRRLLLTGLAVTACVVAVIALVYPVLLARIGPTPEELAERFSVFADDMANPSGAVAKRILALDANGDTYVDRNELPERMQGLMRGDWNGDGVLATNEVKELVKQAAGSRPRLPPPPVPRGRSTTLVDVVRDQKFPPPKHAFVMALLKNPGVRPSPEMGVRLRKVLDREEYENLKAAMVRAGVGHGPGE